MTASVAVLADESPRHRGHPATAVAPSGRGRRPAGPGRRRRSRRGRLRGLTVRNVARRAGVAPATAYTYFSSKDHLLAEVLWRGMEALPAVRRSIRTSRSRDRVADDGPSDGAVGRPKAQPWSMPRTQALREHQPGRQAPARPDRQPDPSPTRRGRRSRGRSSGGAGPRDLLCRGAAHRGNRPHVLRSTSPSSWPVRQS